METFAKLFTVVNNIVYKFTFYSLIVKCIPDSCVKGDMVQKAWQSRRILFAKATIVVKIHEKW